uniref:Uncharacterized protein n=1 Tax=Rhizophora mucronata TaxID=61149 RepID=A0A2P2PBT4_RHIMU
MSYLINTYLPNYIVVLYHGPYISMELYFAWLFTFRFSDMS